MIMDFFSREQILKFYGIQTSMRIKVDKHQKECLPNVFHIGPTRCGTTLFYNSIRSTSANSFVTQIKELHFLGSFDRRTRGPLENLIKYSGIDFDYLEKNPKAVIHTKDVTSFSDYIELFINSSKYKYRFDISPSYHFYRKIVSRNIKQNFPQAIIIFTPRDPIVRSLSNYYLLYERNKLTLFDIITNESRMLQKGWEFFWAIRGQSIYYPTIKEFSSFKNFIFFPFELLSKNSDEKNLLEDKFQFKFSDEKINSYNPKYVELIDKCDICVFDDDKDFNLVLDRLKYKGKISDPFHAKEIFSKCSEATIFRVSSLFRDDIKKLNHVMDIGSIWKTKQVLDQLT